MADPLMMGQGYQGMPGQPNFIPIYDPLSMSTLPLAQQQMAGINLQPLNQSVQNFANMANAQGPSPWAQAAGQQQNALLQNELERGGQTAQGQTAQAESQLAQSGGLSSGARERAAEGGATNAMNMGQNAQRQNSLNQLQIGVNDQQNKMQQLGMLPGLQEAALQPQFQQAGNILQAANLQNQNTMMGNQAANQWNLGQNQQQLQAWAANQQANATQNSGKK